MLPLALDLIAWLVAAALLGFAVAWLLRGIGIAELNAQVQRLEIDLSLREHELGEARRVAARAIDLAGTTAHPAASMTLVPESASQLPHPATTAEPDDLKRIRGVGPVLEKRLHELGVHHFRQVALWTDADIDFFDRELRNFHGRIRRENWVHSATEEHFKKHGEWLAAGAAKPTRGVAHH